MSGLYGMIPATTAAASKALTGHYRDLTVATGMPISQCGIEELKKLSAFLANKNFLTIGLGSYSDCDAIAIPAIIIEQPKTLVDIGDTISAFSLLEAH